MPTINKRFLLRLMAFVVLLGGGIFTAHYLQSDRVHRALLWQSERAAQEGKHDLAIAYLRQYLEFQPNDLDATVTLTEYLQKRNPDSKGWANILFLYEKILREDPHRDEIRRRAIRVCIELQRFGDAMTHANVLLEKNLADGLLWHQIAFCQSRQNKHDEARQAYETAIRLAPQQIRSYEMLAHLLIRQLNQPAAAATLLDRMVQANPHDPEALLVRARYLKSVHRLQECEQDLDRLLRLDPENADGLLMLSEILQGRGEIQQARVILSEGLKLHHRKPEFYRSLSWLELCSGNIPGAAACLIQGTRLLPNELELLTPLADLMVQQGEVEKARAILRKLEARRTTTSQIRYLKARLLMHEQKWTEALEQFEKLRTEAVNLPGLAIQVNLLMSVCHRRLGNRQEEVEALQRVIALDGNNLSARLSLGNLKLNQGKIEEALRDYAVVAASPYAPMETRVLLARLRLARLRNGKGDAAEVKALADYIAELQHKHRNAVEPTLLKAEWLMQQKQADHAVQLLRQEVGRRPNDARVWVALAQAVSRIEGIQAGLSVLDEGQSLVGDHADLRLARAYLWLRDPSPERGQGLRQLEQALTDLSDSDQTRLLYGLADVYAGLRDFASVRRLYERLAERQPKDVPIRRAFAELALAEGDTTTFRQLREAIRQLENGENPTVAFLDLLALVEQATAKGRPKNTALLLQAKQKLHPALQKEPSRAELHSLMARVAEALGDSLTAAKEHALAVELDRSNLMYLQAYLTFLMHQGQDGPTRRLIDALLQDARLTPERFRAMMDNACQGISPARFQALVGWMQPYVESDPESRLWLGTLADRLGYRELALTQFREAVRQLPHHPDAWRALTALLIRTGQSDQADRLVRSEARQALNDRGYALLCAATVSDFQNYAKRTWTPPAATAEAKRATAQARLALLLSRNDRAAAIDLLKTFADEAKDRPADAAWAKRNLALLRAINGSGEERSEAVAYLKELAAEPSDAPEERRARVAILATAYRHLEAAERKALLAQAIETLQTLTREPQQASPTDLFHLAQLYRHQGNHPAYRQTLEQLLRLDGNNLAYLTGYADELLFQGELDAVAPIIRQLLKNYADDFRAVAVIARYYVRTATLDRLTQLVDDYIRAADPTSNDASLRIRQVAELLENLTQSELASAPTILRQLRTMAIERYQSIHRIHPETVVNLASLMATDDQVPAAFELLTRMRSQLAPRVLTMAGLGIVRFGNVTPRQIQTVRGWIESALQDQPHDVALLLGLAELQAMQQDYAAAEASYRRVLQADPNNVFALNNLAWILAPRTGESAQALEYVQKAIRLTGQTGELLDTRARIRIAAGDYAQAIDDLTEAIREQPTSLRYFHLAMARLKQAKPNEAQIAFRKAKQRGIDERTVHPSDIPTLRQMQAQFNDS